MRTKQLILALAAALLLSGCGWMSQGPKQRPEAVPYDDAALYNFQLGRHYQSRGRLELARDRFLQALATADNPDMRERAAREIEATDRLIRSQR